MKDIFKTAIGTCSFVDGGGPSEGRVGAIGQIGERHPSACHPVNGMRGRAHKCCCHTPGLVELRSLSRSGLPMDGSSHARKHAPSP